MTRQILFNGAILTRPGAYTKIDASQFANVALLGLGIVGLIGDADGGQPHVTQVFSSDQAVKATYRSGNLVEAAHIAADPGNDDLIPAGAQTIVCYKTNNSTQSTFTHDTTFLFTSKDWGLQTTSIQVAISSSSGSLRTVQVTGVDSFGNLITETSPEFGDPTKFGKFSIQYTGAAATSTLTITATTLTTTNAGAVDQLNITFSQYNSLADVLFFIAGTGKYAVTTLITNAGAFDPSNLDALAAVTIKAAPVVVMANNFDLSDWLNNNSSLITSLLTKGQTGPRAILAKTALTGGTRGTSSNADWAAAFTAMGGVQVNQLVTLASRDAVTIEGTYTIASINAGLQSHCQLLSSTAGRSERQGFPSFQGTKANLILQAQALNSEHVCLSGQKASRVSAVTANITQFDEWSYAVILAGMRAGAPLGEPLTHKLIKASALTNDASWSTTNSNDIVDLLLNGIIFSTLVQGRGFQIEKGITTYTKSNNDAFIEESIVQNWKLISATWRTALEQRYVGRPMDAGRVLTVKPFSAGIFRDLRDRGVITDSVVNGVQTPGFGNITVNATQDVINASAQVSPTPGINFVLGTAVLVPPQFSI